MGVSHQQQTESDDAVVHTQLSKMSSFKITCVP